MVRAGAINHILRCRQLFQQFVVDMYAKIESERLLFVRLNQKKLRVDKYIHLMDAIVNDGNADNTGQLVILITIFFHRKPAPHARVHTRCSDIC